MSVYLLVFIFGFFIQYVFRRLQNFCISIYGKKVYKEEYVIIPTDNLLFFFAFFFYSDLWSVLFLYLGFVFNPILRYFLGNRNINLLRAIVSPVAVFLPLLFMCMILKFFIKDVYEYYYYLFAFIVYILMNKFLSIFILNYFFGGKKNLNILEKVFNVGFAESFMFSQFILSYISFLLFVNNSYSFLFLVVIQFLFWGMIYHANILIDYYQELINTLLNLLQEYDMDTYKHSERVSIIAGIIAKSIGLSKDEIDSIVLAAKLHDIGKIDTPYSILRKEGKLTDTEFKIITLHPIIASKIVEDIMHSQEQKFIKYHHFYPTVFDKPVSYKDIPLGARIIMVADVYDALRSKRKYKSSLTHNEAIKELLKMVNKNLLDISIVSVLIDSFDQYSELYKENEENGNNNIVK